LWWDEPGFDTTVPMEKKFKKAITSLDDVFDFVGEYMDSHSVDAAVTYSINLAIEEFFTNMVKYSPENNDDISVSIAKDKNKLTVRMVDSGVEPFDVTKTGEVNTLKPLKERKPGGLGIHIAKQMVDSIEYEYVDRQSRITFTKILEK
jgi:anti-sigma regulatory factor (Ser/Thr protein kinase)